MLILLDYSYNLLKHTSYELFIQTNNYLLVTIPIRKQRYSVISFLKKYYK